jgi:hypothetical protein
VTRKRTRSTRGDVSITLELSDDDLARLARLAPYYEKALGPMRHVVMLTARGDIRKRYTFIREERHWLETVVSELQQERVSGTGNTGSVRLPSRTVIAFWGRAIACLTTRRSRRKLDSDEIAAMERLESTLRMAAQRLLAQDAAAVERDLSTRRASEIKLMRAALYDSQDPPTE